MARTAGRVRALASRHPEAVIASAVTLLVLLPLLWRGFVLSYDMVFVPRARLSADLLGLGRTVPRGVPFGLLVALSSRVVPGDLVQKVVLVGTFGGAAWGAARLVPEGRGAARAAAGVLYAWNPFTYERILLGHLPFLLSYAALPWVVGAAVALRRGRPGAPARVVLALGVAAFASPYGGLFAAAAAVAVVAFPPWRPGERPGVRGGGVALASLVLNLPWLVPSILRPGGLPSSDVAFSLFRSRADSPAGLLGSLLSLGGLWRTDLAPPGRATVAWIPAFVLILAVGLSGWSLLSRRWPRGAALGLLAASALGGILAVGVSAPAVGGAIRWAGEHAPGGGILRDGQKFVGPWAVLLSVAFGLGVDRILAGTSSRRARTWAAAGLVILPVALAPTLAWGAWGRLSTVRYPLSWDRMAAASSSDPAPGAVLVLPWHLHIPFSWNRERVVIQPASAYLDREVVGSDRLEVGSSSVPDEDPWSARARPLVEGGGPLARGLSRLGVRDVVLFKEADWEAYRDRLSGLDRVLDTADLAVYRSPSPAVVQSFPTPPALPVLVGDGAAVILLMGAGIASAMHGRRRVAPREKRLIS